MLDRHSLAIAILAGILAQLMFELYAWIINPMIFGFSLQPALLVKQLAAAYPGVEVSYETAFVLHVFVGVVLFPAGYLFLRRLAGCHLRHWLLAGTAYGIILWFVAQGVLAPMVGRDFMMGFQPYTWASLVAHPLMAVAIAGVYFGLYERREKVQRGSIARM